MSAAGLGDRVFDVVNGSDATITGLTVSGGNPPDDPNQNNNSLGGGISKFGAGDLELNEVVVSDNTAPNGVGGGIFNGDATLTIIDSTVSGNSASRGGDIFNQSSSSRTRPPCATAPSRATPRAIWAAASTTPTA